MKVPSETKILASALNRDFNHPKIHPASVWRSFLAETSIFSKVDTNELRFSFIRVTYNERSREALLISLASLVVSDPSHLNPLIQDLDALSIRPAIRNANRTWH